jgi:hypothetical protein
MDMLKRRGSAFFAITVGMLMIGRWSMLILSSQVPGFDSAQVEIKLHMLTEMLTALMLIVGGLSVFMKWKHTELHIVSQGMLLYAILNSSGYYIDRGEMGMVFMFGVLLVGTVVSLMLFVS